MVHAKVKSATCCTLQVARYLLHPLYNVAVVQHVGNMLQGIEHCSISHNMLLRTSKDLYDFTTVT